MVSISLKMYRRTITTLLLLLSHGATHGADISVPQWKVTLAAGQGVIENPLEDHQDGETFLLPSFSYYGKRFFLSDLTVGYSLVENERFYVDVIARPNEDGLYFQLDKAEATTGSLSSILTLFDGPKVSDIDRRVSVMAGPSATLVTALADVSLSWLHDASGVHDGSEIHLSLDKQYPLFGGAIGAGIGAVHKDTKLVNYYYHFTDGEAGAFTRLYARKFPPGEVTDQYARLHFSYPLSRRFELRLATRYNHFDLDGRNALFIAKPETLSWFAGIQYTIGSGR